MFLHRKVGGSRWPFPVKRPQNTKVEHAEALIRPFESQTPH